MPDVTAQERFRRWYSPWKERVCEEVRPFSHGTVFRSPRHPDFWEYNCIRLDRPMEASEMIAAADRALAGCEHRLVEWMIPMPDGVARELRERGWMATALIYMLHDGRTVPDRGGELVEVDYDAVRRLRDIWHREDFGEHTEPATFHAQAREVAELADVRVIAAMQEGRAIGFAQVETHDGGSEVSQVFVRPECRGAGLGSALTARAIRTGTDAAAGSLDLRRARWSPTPTLRAPRLLRGRGDGLCDPAAPNVIRWSAASKCPVPRLQPRVPPRAVRARACKEGKRPHRCRQRGRLPGCESERPMCDAGRHVGAESCLRVMGDSLRDPN